MTVKSSISLTDEHDGQHAFASALEIEALRELVSRRQKGEFISPDEMDVRLERMFAEKRHGALGRTREA